MLHSHGGVNMGDSQGQPGQREKGALQPVPAYTAALS